jgi:hypothetical protein
MKEKMKLSGHFTAKLIGPDGNVKEERKSKNTVVDEGFDMVCQRFFSTQTGSAAFNYIGIGSDDTAAAAGNTTLGYVLALAQGTYAHTDGEANLSLTNTFAAGTGTGSVNEYGILNGSPTGDMFNRATMGTIVKNAADSLQIVFAGSLS